MPFKIPAWLQIFLDFTCDLDFQDELLGDLFELFEREASNQGNKKAKRKFTRRALFSVRWYRLPAFQQIPHIMLFQNFYKVAVRHAARHRSASSIHALGLILGLGAAFYIGLYLKTELYVDTMHQHSEQLYRVLRENPQNGDRSIVTSSNHGQKLKEAFPFIKMARFGQDPVKIGDQQTLLLEDFYWADSTFFDLFTFDFIAGDPKTCLKEINSIVLTESKAMHLFQSTDIIGQTIKVKVYDSNEEFPMQIKGVVKDPSDYTHIQFDGLGSMANAEKMYAQLVPNWYFSWLRTYIQVPDQRIAEVRAGIPGMITAIFGDDPPMNFGIGLQPFSAIYLHSQDIEKSTLKGSIRNLQIFGAIGLLILLISLLNFINLATARSVTRAKEVGIRKVVGAQQAGIIGQFLVESLLFTLGSGIIGIGLVLLTLPKLNQLFGFKLSLAALAWTDFFVIILALIVLGILAGLIPAIVMTKIPSIGKEDQGNKIDFGINRWSFTRKMFVGIQYFVAIALVGASMVFYQQYNYLKNFDLGFNPEQLLHISVEDRKIQEQLPLLKEQISQLGGVLGTSMTGEDLPSALNNTWGIRWTGMAPDRNEAINIVGVDQDYFELLDIPFAEGENFRMGYEVDSAKSVILNESAAKIIEVDDLVGQTISIDDQPKRVVGIVKDYHNTSLHSTIQPLAYMIFPPGFRVSADNILARVETDNIKQLLPQLEQVWSQFSTDPFNYNFVDEAFAGAYEKEKRFTTLISSFSFIAIAISIVGLFGLINFIIQLKLKEIGIRRVLGASKGQLLSLLGKEFLIVFIIASILAIPVAYYFLGDWLTNYEYRINLSAWQMIPAILLCLLTSVSVIWFHLQRASRVNPSEIIKTE